MSAAGQIDFDFVMTITYQGVSRTFYQCPACGSTVTKDGCQMHADWHYRISSTQSSPMPHTST